MLSMFSLIAKKKTLCYTILEEQFSAGGNRNDNKYWGSCKYDKNK